MSAPGWARAGAGRGWFRAPGFAPGTSQEELAALKETIKGLEEALNAAKAHLAELEKAQPAT